MNVLPERDATPDAMVDAGRDADDALDAGADVDAAPDAETDADAEMDADADGPLRIEELTATPTSGQAPLSVAFEAEVVGGKAPDRFSWSFGDGTPGVVGGQEQTHIYTRAGTFVARVLVSDADGSSITLGVEVEVESGTAPEISQIVASPMVGVAPLSVDFRAVIAGEASGLEYAWDFGDGETSSEPSPTHTYQMAGRYIVELIVTDPDTGLASGPASLTVQATSDDAPVARALAMPNRGAAPLLVAFQGSGFGGNGDLTYAWDFGDGSAPSNLQNPTHSYATPGTYNATLTVTDEDGDSDSESVQIVVLSASGSIPQVSASASDTSGRAPLVVRFGSTVVGGDAPYTYSWDFGDGSTGTGARPSHRYEMAGIYTATVRVVDQDGDADSDTITITVSPDSVPRVSATAAPSGGLAPLSTTLTAIGSGGDGALTYSWMLGDGTSATGPSVTHTYQSAGRYRAMVEVRDADGDIARATVLIDVASIDTPIARASSIPDSGLAPLTVFFFGNSTGGNGQISYSWNFGDGSTSTDRNPQHTYQAPGIYTATLIVTDADGDSSSSQIVIEVEAINDFRVKIAATPRFAQAPANVDFEAALSRGTPPYLYSWTFGDGSPRDNASDPAHSYLSAGSYDVTVLVVDANGRAASDTVRVNIGDDDKPAARALVDVTTGASPLTVAFQGEALGGNAPLSYAWDFGDSVGTSTMQNPTYTYTMEGRYVATLTVTDADGDVSSFPVTIDAVRDGPDLTITNLTAMQSGDSLLYEVMIKNIGGSVASDDFVVRLFDNIENIPPGVPTRDTSPTMSRLIIEDLMPNEERSFAFEIEEATIGDHFAYAFLDPTLEVPDVDRSNNLSASVSSVVEGIVINEVFYDPVGMDNATMTGSGAFVELYTTPMRDLGGFKIERYRADATLAETYTIPAGTQSDAQGFLLLIDGAAPPGAGAVMAGSAVNGGNDGGAFRLIDPSGNALDAVAWGTAGAAVMMRGETTASFDVREGYSLGRNATGADLDNNLQDFFVWRVPTPGAFNRLMLTNEADECADAYLLSDGQQGKFLIEANLGAASNTFTSVDQSKPGCNFSQIARTGHDQIFSFVVPTGRTASVELILTEKADIEIDGVLSESPCGNIAATTIGCNPSGTSSFGGLSPGTYYLVVLEDGPVSLASANEPYRYVVQINFN